MSIAPDSNVTLPSGIVPEEDAMDQLARLRATLDDEPQVASKSRDGKGDLRYGRATPWNGRGSKGQRANDERIANGEQRAHVIARVRFGEGRYTECASCDFRCTGESDRAMAKAWNEHSYLYTARHEREHRSGPVERFPAGSAS